MIERRVRFDDTLIDLKEIQIHVFVVATEKWKEKAEKKSGSWCPTWHNWLENHSQAKTNPPEMGTKRKGLKPLEDAPGQYVFIQ